MSSTNAHEGLGYMFILFVSDYDLVDTTDARSVVPLHKPRSSIGYVLLFTHFSLLFALTLLYGRIFLENGEPI